MINKIEDKICLVLPILIAIILMVLICLNIVQVITRYFVNVIIVWLEEATILGIYWMTAFGMPLLTFKNEHLLMDISGKILPSFVKFIVEWMIMLGSLLAGIGFMVVGHRAYLINMGYHSSILGFDECFRYVPLMVCGALMIVAAVFRVLRAVGKMKRGGQIYQ